MPIGNLMRRIDMTNGNVNVQSGPTSQPLSFCRNFVEYFPQQIRNDVMIQDPNTP